MREEEEEEEEYEEEEAHPLDLVLERGRYS